MLVKQPQQKKQLTNPKNNFMTTAKKKKELTPLERINDAIYFSGIKKQFVAEQLKLTPQHLSRVLNGHDTLTKDVQDKLFTLLHIA